MQVTATNQIAYDQGPVFPLTLIRATLTPWLRQVLKASQVIQRSQAASLSSMATSSKNVSAQEKDLLKGWPESHECDQWTMVDV